MHPFLNNYFNIVKKLLPGPKQISSVGLDIGVSECKLVELSKVGDALELSQYLTEPIVAGNIPTAIKNVLTRLKSPCKSPYTALSGKGTLIRYVEMPRMTLEELKNSFGIESDKYFPFPQDKIYTDCHILESQPTQKQMSVLAAAVKKELVDQRIKFLNDLGLQTQFISVDPIALANVINVLGIKKEEKKDTAIALLDMGETVLNLTIFVNRLPRFTRDIYIGGRDFTKSISSALTLNLPEAEKLKLSPGVRKDEVIAAYEATVMNIIQEIKLSFDYFVTERNKEIGSLMLTGGSSLLVGIDQVFKKNLELETFLWNPFESLNLSSTISKEDLIKVAPKLTVALGLALYNYD